MMMLCSVPLVFKAKCAREYRKVTAGTGDGLLAEQEQAVGHGKPQHATALAKGLR